MVLTARNVTVCHVVYSGHIVVQLFVIAKIVGVDITRQHVDIYAMWWWVISFSMIFAVFDV